MTDIPVDDGSWKFLIVIDIILNDRKKEEKQGGKLQV